MATTPLTALDGSVPFGELIYWYLQLPDHEAFRTLAKMSYPYQEHYLAWEEVRRGNNPFFENGTGFEGYLVGVCTSPAQALEEMIKIGSEMLDNVLKLHRFENRFHADLINTLNGEAANPKAMLEWSAEFGATLARLRCNLLHNPQADAYHSETYGIVRWLPDMVYVQQNGEIKQHYTILRREVPVARIMVHPYSLKPAEQEAWQIADSIGKFGHPLVREFMILNWHHNN